ncbi:alpha beta-hydrolase [Coniophora puteana RWD-64-598 SS2]|uniref:Alpha beta-hydrolase n=1 Tax=Coniophora puteana (strain RWD-64-598) TaxID=741705 RepID=A0A5M3M942_CONPW|nr:alpha beta-hydrolase [Coniophora puteana RWD-64-598 SS2]EIW75597.1 alpha beta-hydrolase [Coniophora puteana RWD-64-598 SS2]
MYYLKLIGIKAIRALLPIALLFEEGLPNRPKPDHTLHIPSSDRKRGSIRVDVYLPSLHVPDHDHTESEHQASQPLKDSRTTDSGNTTPPTSPARLPIVLNLHGSGFCLPVIGQDAVFCRQVADSVHAVVLDVDYAHAPEFPYPAALDDIDTVLEWLRDTTAGRMPEGSGKDSSDGDAGVDAKGWDVERLAVTGFSAGGNLALTACVRAFERGQKDPFKAVVAFYPSTNLAEPASSKPSPKIASGASGGTIPPLIRRFFYACYLPSSCPLPRTTPTISPLYADPHAFPRSTTIITCGADALAREGRQLVEKLQSAASEDPGLGLDVVGWEAAGQGHSWDKSTKEGTDPRRMKVEAYELAVRRLREALWPA